MRTLEVIILSTQSLCWRSEVIRCRKIADTYNNIVRGNVILWVATKEHECNTRYLEKLLSSTQMSMCDDHKQDKVESPFQLRMFLK